MAQRVNDGDDKSSNIVFRCTVRSDAHRVKTLVIADNFPVDRRQVLQNGLSVGNDVFFGERMRKDLQRPTNVLSHQLKFSSNIFCEFTDIEFAVDKKDADHGRRQEVSKVVVHHRELIELLLVFGINRIEFFIDGLQFFIGALQFLIGCQKLFIGRLQFFVYGLKFTDG